MYSSRNEYDRGVNTFSPEGRLFQVEYALGAVYLGSTAIGIDTKDGIIICTEKRINNNLMEDTEDLKKISKINDHIISASTGIIADARMLIEHARIQSVNHWFNYNEEIRVKACVDSLAELYVSFSGLMEGKKPKMSRPFGVALLIGGYDGKEGNSLYTIDPSGTVIKYKAIVIGSGHEGANQTLQELYKDNLNLDEGLDLILTVLRRVMEEKMTEKNVEVCIVSSYTGKAEVVSAQKINEVISRLPPLSEIENIQTIA